MSEAPATFPVALNIECSAFVTHPDGTTDGDDEETEGAA